MKIFSARHICHSVSIIVTSESSESSESCESSVSNLSSLSSVSSLLPQLVVFLKVFYSLFFCTAGALVVVTLYGGTSYHSTQPIKLYSHIICTNRHNSRVCSVNGKSNVNSVNIVNRVNGGRNVNSVKNVNSVSSMRSLQCGVTSISGGIFVFSFVRL